MQFPEAIHILWFALGAFSGASLTAIVLGVIEGRRPPRCVRRPRSPELDAFAKRQRERNERPAQAEDAVA